MTGLRTFLSALVAAAALAAMPAASQPRRWEGIRSDGPARRDWLRTVHRTDEGGFRIGDPNAGIKLVEYVAPSCVDCARFAYESSERLFQQYVRTGRVSVEYRVFYGNGVDIAAGMLADCVPQNDYFDMMHNLLGSQRDWLGRVAQVTPQQRQELGALPPLEVARRMVTLLGLDAVARRSGLEVAAQRTCLTQERLDRVGLQQQAATQAGVTGAPAFFVNGERVSATTWAQLEPLLRGR